MRRPSSAEATSSSSSSSGEPRSGPWPVKVLSHSRAVRALMVSKLAPNTRWIATCLVYRSDDYTAGTTRFQASIKWLAFSSGFSVRVVIRHLRILMREGYVRSEARFARDGSRLANVYFLELPKFGRPELVKGAPPEAAKEHARRRAAELEPSSRAASRELLAALGGAKR